jgi:WD40 repeat protein
MLDFVPKIKTKRIVMKYIKTILLLYLILLFSGCGANLSPEPMPKYTLKLDTKGSMDDVWDIELANDNKDLILAGADKTIRVIDTKTWKEKRKILGQIGEGIKGQIYAIALSPDSKYLAVGGALYNEEGGYEDVRIYNYHSGKIIKVLKNLSYYSDANPRAKKDSVFDLDYSEDGRYLAVGSRNNEVYVFDTKKNFLKVHEDYRRNDVYSVKIIKKSKEKYVLSTSYDGSLKLSCFTNKKIKPKYKKLKISLRFLDATKYNGGEIAVAGKYASGIYIFDYDLNLKHRIINGGAFGLGHGNPIGKLKYSPNGDYLAAGSVDGPFNVNIYDAKSKKYDLIGVFKKHTNTILAINFLNNNTIISSGGNNYETYIYKIKKINKSKRYIIADAKKQINFSIKQMDIEEKKKEKYLKYIELKDRQVLKKLDGEGNAIYSVGINGENIAFGTKAININNPTSPLKKSMNLNSFKISSKLPVKFKQLPTKNGEYSLESAQLGYVSRKLKVLKNGKIDSVIVRDKNNGMIHNKYGWYKDYIISSGSNGVITIYNKSGSVKANFIGHIGEVYALAVDGDRLISGGSDQTMKIWNLSQIESKDKIKPLINIFVSKDNEYILWTKEGFFDASPKATEYIGYHINQGSLKEAEYVTVENLYSTFFRPDLIKKALKGDSLEKYAKNINIEKIIKDGLAPDVQILTKTRKTTKPDLNLKVQVCPKGIGGYDNLALTINDIPVQVIDTSRALKIKKKSKKADCFTYDQTITLTSGKNKIGFKATNKAGSIESNVDYLNVRYNNKSYKKSSKPRLSKAKGNYKYNDLHILTIAVNKYNDKELQLNYSINDATQMLKTIKKVAKPLFKKVHTYTLFDDKVTKENINKIFKNIKSKREDVFLLYIAGHGITDEYNGNYYFIPHNFINKADENAVQKQGVGQKDFMFGLSNITALKSLVLLDTCNSGSFVEADMQKTTTNRLAKATGRATISASSKSQVALEGFNDHGVFTYTLLEALKGKGYKGDNKITTNELSDYVEEILPNRTYKKWGYRQIPQKSMYGVDFKLGVK